MSAANPEHHRHVLQRIVVIGLLTLVVCSSLSMRQCPAIPRWGRSSRTSQILRKGQQQAQQAAQQRRQQMIQALNQQITAATQVLSQIQSNAAKTEQELKAANARLEGIRQSVEGAHEDAAVGAKTLREIETELIRQQGTDSELAKAERTLEEARLEVHETIMLVTQLPPIPIEPGKDPKRADIARLSAQQYESLKRDQRYQGAEAVCRSAAAAVAHIRKDVFEQDSAWRSAHRDLLAANKREKESAADRSHAGAEVARDRGQLRSQQSIASEAQAMIARAQDQLRQLGVNPKKG
ncbi:MAG: hypothetical protein KDA85_19110 [Planctomycetaceae bacterium]|nr:hypothetical protein [Planctomycetaceae bacterium]